MYVCKPFELNSMMDVQLWKNPTQNQQENYTGNTVTRKFADKCTVDPAFTVEPPKQQICRQIYWVARVFRAKGNKFFPSVVVAMAVCAVSHGRGAKEKKRRLLATNKSFTLQLLSRRYIYIRLFFDFGWFFLFLLCDLFRTYRYVRLETISIDPYTAHVYIQRSKRQISVRYCQSH